MPDCGHGILVIDKVDLTTQAVNYDIIIPRARLDDDIDIQEQVSNLDQESSSSPTII